MRCKSGMRITSQDIRRAFGEPTFSRGKDYFARGKVRAVKIAEDLD